MLGIAFLKTKDWCT